MGKEQLISSLVTSGLKHVSKAFGKKGVAVAIEGKGKNIIKLFDKKGEKLLKTKVKYSDGSSVTYDHRGKDLVRIFKEADGSKTRCVFMEPSTINRKFFDLEKGHGWYESPNKFIDWVGKNSLRDLLCATGGLALFVAGLHAYPYLSSNDTQKTKLPENAPKAGENPGTDKSNKTGESKKANEASKTAPKGDEKSEEPAKTGEANQDKKQEESAKTAKTDQDVKTPKDGKQDEKSKENKEEQLETKEAKRGDTYWGYAKFELINEHIGDANYKPSNKEIVVRMHEIMKRNGAELAEDGIHPSPMLKVGDKVKLKKKQEKQAT